MKAAKPASAPSSFTSSRAVRPAIGPASSITSKLVACAYGSSGSADVRRASGPAALIPVWDRRCLAARRRDHRDHSISKVRLIACKHEILDSVHGPLDPLG